MIDQFDIQIDDLNPDFREVAETIGLEPALKLVQARGGEAVWIPRLEKICRAARDRAIRAEFNGHNFRELARKYRLTVVWIRNIVGEHAADEKGKPIDKQRSLF